MKYCLIFAIFLVIVPKISWANSDLNLGLNVQIVFGSHNHYLRAGVVTFASVHESNIAVEAGSGVWVQASVQRFNANALHWSAGYDAFALLGYGDNSNQLGSALLESSTASFFSDTADKGFIGLGFGVNSEYFSGSLNKFSQRRGRAIVRLATRQRSLHITFSNDLRDGLFNGEATDYAQTSAARIKYSEIRNNRLNQYGLGFDLFTPEPDSSLAPNNQKNSADGRRRVWFTTEPWANLFNANLFLEYGRQTDRQSWSVKLGIDSPKLGAFAQNSIHDEFGLTPRFPWPVEKPDGLFFESTFNSLYE